ncbi:unnamed protein product [Urochloa decumbens]|uniref:non-specific serine/threonine protein kinase n=1 Tax=Urochloa decumbens TaxID=240449 RepID=A0ABC8ZQ87_9POAL
MVSPGLMVTFFFTMAAMAAAALDLDDLRLLEQFKAALPNDTALAGWNSGNGVCSFPGVDCKNSRVTSVSLIGVKLNANFSSVASTLLHLSSVEAITVRDANISGELSALSQVECGEKLSLLDLSGNYISGEVPAFINCSGLEYLDLSGNLVSGSIAVGVLSGCGSLSSLNLSGNHLVGAFPTDIAHLTSLTALNLSSNSFSGEIPGKAFVNLSKLRTLSLSFNHFNGSILGVVTMLPELQTLELGSNLLSGTIPATLCSSNTSSKLQVLYLQNNYITGGIPEAISNCAGLVSLDLSLNYINGQIPSSIGMLTGLRDLVLWQNALDGEIPASLSRMLALEKLILDYNALSGSIPSSLANCTELKWVSLASNRLSGPLPSWFSRFVKLQILRLGNNSFSGVIPPELGDCRSLLWLDLSGNQLKGHIPSELAKQSGKMEPQIFLAQLGYLRNDELREYQCHGKGSLLDLTGVRRGDLSRMPSRKACNFTSMYFGMLYPDTKNNFSMIFLDLSFNQLDSEIPKDLGSMYYLLVMNLGHNSLSGEIPDDLGAANHLAVLDLSHNMLEGLIPNSLSTLSLSDINLSNNRLSGMIPQLGSLATFPAISFENNSGLCGFPLPPCKQSVLETQQPKSHKRQVSLVGITVAAFSLLLFALLTCLCQMKRPEAHNNANEALRLQGNLFSIWNFDGGDVYKQIVEATGNFDEKYCIGRGGHGSVYEAQLPTGEIFAVKKIRKTQDDSLKNEKLFNREIEALVQIRHRNVVKLYGYCSTDQDKFLIYEYMERGSLSRILMDKNCAVDLDWNKRLNIARDVAHALSYLHHDCSSPVVHRDVTSNNVLIDMQFRACISDFGLAKIMSLDASSCTSKLAGTAGYLAPELAYMTRVTEKCDVYSFSVVILELFMGSYPSDFLSALLSTTKKSASLKDLLDTRLPLPEGEVAREIFVLFMVALQCLDPNPGTRLTMLSASQKLSAGPTTGDFDYLHTDIMDTGTYVH